MDRGAGIETVAVPPGRVTLSDRRTRRSRQAEVAPSEMAAYPVTQASYERITGLPRYGPLDEIAWYRGNADGRVRAGAPSWNGPRARWPSQKVRCSDSRPRLARTSLARCEVPSVMA
ncbi:hypothetical protein TU94_02930 [Streptomyces cyaneogriseus subsp. noncyanogenus]|uniref:Sulfatase-modifying factor enzyme domain-containing protein n=1 Tax=Streptomyces cyaneogriseus subsp. noncyanogenus TaxID=477245 RepID=A0A0C5G994_9ACTN|nr:hypothetical protein TU94_02930 [Streptomyces cyaneogriseus subsp. noncyanogenus]